MKGSIMDASESTRRSSDPAIQSESSCCCRKTHEHCFSHILSLSRLLYSVVSDAIEGAEVMLYGVTLRYKESANVSQAAV
jgi:hypothetical protein